MTWESKLQTKEIENTCPISINVTLEQDEMVDVFMGCAINDGEIFIKLRFKILKCFLCNFPSKVIFQETLKNSSAPCNRDFDFGFPRRFPNVMTQRVHSFNTEISVCFYDFFNLLRRRIVQRQVKWVQLFFTNHSLQRRTICICQKVYFLGFCFYWVGEGEGELFYQFSHVDEAWSEKVVVHSNSSLRHKDPIRKTARYNHHQSSTHNFLCSGFQKSAHVTLELSWICLGDFFFETITLDTALVPCGRLAV